MAAGCKKLETFNLFSCNNITADGLKEFTNLIELALGMCRNINDPGVAVLLESCKELKTFILSGCDLNGVGFAVLPEGYPKLEILDLSYCDDINDASLGYIAKSMSKSKKGLVCFGVIV